MSDRRSLRANQRVAHVSLRGQTGITQLVEGETFRIARDVTDLCNNPHGDRDRQLVRGEDFCMLDAQDGWAFGFAERDGYVGWIETAHFMPQSVAPTHMVTAPRSYCKTSPGLKDMGRVTPLSFGSRLSVVREIDGWAEIDWSRGLVDIRRYVPLTHLTSLPLTLRDPVSVAQKFLGTPYLWGGNSAFGIDCSGLIQAAFLACGIPCPGDSDQQEAALGSKIEHSDPLQRGDLLFWRGHVAMVVDDQQLIHANAHHMAVTYEGINAAIERIEASADGPVTSRRRVRL